MEKKIETLAELKGEEVRLRNELDSKNCFTMNTVIEYSRVRHKIKQLESWLLWTIVSLILMLSIGGCQTAKGMMGDAGWLLQTGAENIQVKEK